MLLPGLGGRQVLLVPPALRPRCPHASGATGLEITRGQEEIPVLPGHGAPGAVFTSKAGVIFILLRLPLQEQFSEQRSQSWGRKAPRHWQRPHGAGCPPAPSPWDCWGWGDELGGCARLGKRR